MKKYLNICEEILGESHLNTADEYGIVAEVYRYKRKYDEALHWFQMCLAIE